MKRNDMSVYHVPCIVTACSIDYINTCMDGMYQRYTTVAIVAY
jgi:hypothetical protein